MSKIPEDGYVSGILSRVMGTDLLQEGLILLSSVALCP